MNICQHVIMPFNESNLPDEPRLRQYDAPKNLVCLSDAEFALCDATAAGHVIVVRRCVRVCVVERDCSVCSLKPQGQLLS